VSVVFVGHFQCDAETAFSQPTDAAND
jgi:hypothetical protein